MSGANSKGTSLWAVVAVGVVGGLVVWALSKAFGKGGGATGFGGSNVSSIHNSTVYMGQQAPSAFGLGAAPLPPPLPDVLPSTTMQTDGPTPLTSRNEPPPRLRYSRTDRRKPRWKKGGGVPVPSFSVQGVTRMDGRTITTAPQPLAGRRDVDTMVTVTNASIANTVRVGETEQQIRSGGGTPIPPNGVVRFPLRAQTNLWAAASGNTQVGLVQAELDRA